MELDKIRNLSDGELGVEGNKAAEQLFRLRFQVKLGQTEGVKKLRGLKKDIARMRTIARERELGLHGAEHKTESSAPVKARKVAKKAPKKAVAKKAVPKTPRKTAAKKAAKKSTKKGTR
ncbi:MAG TPA: 50S ribosomal protein L29 [Silvibacterium sp.]|nr:50S ribosomal protein L29 [Silvibacterium sp.]